MAWLESFRIGFWQQLSEYRLVPWVIGESCCQVELDAVSRGSYGWQRLGLTEVARRPAEANLLIVSGWLNEKLSQEVRDVYAEMLTPRYVMAVGVCTISASPFKFGTSNLTLLSDLVKVDVYVPGCPPRPETLLDAILLLRQQTGPQTQTEKLIYDAIRPNTRTQ